MKKKLILLVVVLVAAVIIVSGCSEDALKDRVPGVKANVNMLLADNDEGDLEYEVGTIKGEEDFGDEEEASFGTQIIEDVEEEIKGIEDDKTIETDSKEYPPNDGGTIENSTTINLDTVDQAKNLEEIIFSKGKLIVNVNDTNNELDLSSIVIDGNSAEIIDSNKAELALEDGLDLTKDHLKVDYIFTVTDYGKLGDINFNLSFSSNVDINNIKVNLSNFDWNSSDYDLSMNEVLIEDYDREDFIDQLSVSDSEMYINFDIAEGIKLDLSKVNVKAIPEIKEDSFSLAEEDLTSDSSRTYLDLKKIISMLQDSETTDVKIIGDIALSSDGTIIITKDSELKIKNVVLESADFKINDYQMDPEAVEEGLKADEVNDIKKGLKQIELIFEDLNNPLPASVDVKVYVKDGANTVNELYNEENQLTSFTMNSNFVGNESIILNKDQYDKFIGDDIYVGVELYSEARFIPDEYSEQTISFDKIKAKFNIDLNVDDLD